MKYSFKNNNSQINLLLFAGAMELGRLTLLAQMPNWTKKAWVHMCFDHYINIYSTID